MFDALASACAAIDDDDVAGSAASRTRRRWRPCSHEPPGDDAHRVSAVGHAHIDSRVAVADPRDEAQVRAHVLERAAPHGGLPRVPLLRVAGAAVRVDEGALSAALRAHARAGRGRPVRADRQHVGRGRLQHPVGRVARAPDRARQAVLPRRVRPGDHRPLAPRRVRLLRRAPADPEGGGHHVVPDPEDVVERDQPLPAQHVLVGGHRRHAHPHALPARRHLQRRHERAASSRKASASSRRRTCRSTRSTRTATATAVAARRGRCSSRRAASPISTACHASSSTRSRRSGRRCTPRRRLPVWVGELYLEYHRGTYTTNGPIKRANRQQRAGVARGRAVVGRGATRRADDWTAYPDDALDESWKLLLLNQFHDIIPGSSIHWANEDCLRDHAQHRRGHGRSDLDRATGDRRAGRHRPT